MKMEKAISIAHIMNVKRRPEEQNRLGQKEFGILFYFWVA